MSNVYTTSKTIYDLLSYATLLTPEIARKFGDIFDPPSAIRVGSKIIVPVVRPEGFKLNGTTGDGVLESTNGYLYTGAAAEQLFQLRLSPQFTRDQVLKLAWIPTKAQTKRLIAFYNQKGQ